MLWRAATWSTTLFVAFPFTSKCFPANTYAIALFLRIYRGHSFRWWGCLDLERDAIAFTVSQHKLMCFLAYWITISLVCVRNMYFYSYNYMCMENFNHHPILHCLAVLQYVQFMVVCITGKFYKALVLQQLLTAKKSRFKCVEVNSCVVTSLDIHFQFSHIKMFVNLS